MFFAGGSNALEAGHISHGEILFHSLYDSIYRSDPRLLKEDFGSGSSQPPSILQEDAEETEKMDSPADHADKREFLSFMICDHLRNLR